MSAVSDFVRQISDEVSELAMKEDNKLMDSIHVHPSPNVENAEKLGDFINKVENKNHCLQEGDFIFLFFNDADDYEERFGGRDDEETSVLGSRPGLYIYQSKKTTKKTPRHGLKIGEAERLHERMQKHTRKSDGDYIGDNPGVVIMKCTENREDDEFNVHEMRKLCEIMVNNFLKSSRRKYDTDARPRVYVSEDGCRQAKELIEALQKAISKNSKLRKIVRIKKTRGKSVNLQKIFKEGGV